nr:hypothetical protein [Alphaproteobacteria bacterium]
FGRVFLIFVIFCVLYRVVSATPGGYGIDEDDNDDTSYFVVYKDPNNPQRLSSEISDAEFVEDHDY